jgi:hypothetical protein
VIDAWRTGSLTKYINHADAKRANLEARMRVRLAAGDGAGGCRQEGKEGGRSAAGSTAEGGGLQLASAELGL